MASRRAERESGTAGAAGAAGSEPAFDTDLSPPPSLNFASDAPRGGGGGGPVDRLVSVDSDPCDQSSE